MAQNPAIRADKAELIASKSVKNNHNNAIFANVVRALDGGVVSTSSRNAKSAQRLRPAFRALPTPGLDLFQVARKIRRRPLDTETEGARRHEKQNGGGSFRAIRRKCRARVYKNKSRAITKVILLKWSFSLDFKAILFK